LEPKWAIVGLLAAIAIVALITLRLARLSGTPTVYAATLYHGADLVADQALVDHRGGRRLAVLDAPRRSKPEVSPRFRLIALRPPSRCLDDPLSGSRQ